MYESIHSNDYIYAHKEYIPTSKYITAIDSDLNLTYICLYIHTYIYIFIHM